MEEKRRERIESEIKEIDQRRELLYRQCEIAEGKTYFENRDIVFCPYCGELYEEELPLDESVHKITCKNCEGYFFVRTVFTKKYTMSVYEEGILGEDESISEDNSDIEALYDEAATDRERDAIRRCMDMI